MYIYNALRKVKLDTEERIVCNKDYTLKTYNSL